MPAASTTVAEPSQTPQASSWPLEQQFPYVSSVAAEPSQHSPRATWPLAQQLPESSMMPEAHVLSSTSQTEPVQPLSQMHWLSSHLHSFATRL